MRHFSDKNKWYYSTSWCGFRCWQQKSWCVKRKLRGRKYRRNLLPGWVWKRGREKELKGSTPSTAFTSPEVRTVNLICNINLCYCSAPSSNIYYCPCFSFVFCSSRSPSTWVWVFGESPCFCFCFVENLNLRSNEFVITPTELKPMRAPAIDGVSMVPFIGNNNPAATGIPTCVTDKIDH